VTIRPPKYNSQGFTLIEMIVTVMVAGILMALATPSLLSLNKPLRDGSLQFKSQLSLIRSKAISSGKSYRIRPKFDTLTTANYPDGRVRNFVVEYADNCKMPENDVVPAKLRWQMASQFDLNLPPNIGITPTGTALSLTDNTPTTATPATSAVTHSVTTSLSWTTSATSTTPGSRICFDNRGILDDTTTKIVLSDFQGFNKATLVELELTTVGNVDIKAYSKITSTTFATTGSSTQDSPSF
jgi:prepilin-type N-terminal cleavage/methylation domain-containing protein